MKIGENKFGNVDFFAYLCIKKNEGNMKKAKFVFVYNGIPFPANSLKEIAENFFGVKVYRGDNGNWFVEENGNPKRMEYTSKENGGGNGYTQEEVERNFLNEHFTLNYANTALYKLCESGARDAK